MSQRSSTTGSSGAPKKIVVVGGNGFVGSHVLKELVAIKRDGTPLQITSLSRSGLPAPASQSWSSEVTWTKGDIGAGDETIKRTFAGSKAVISCVGGFGSVQRMEQINGDANVKAMSLAKSLGVGRFVYISAHHYALPEILQRGYFAGKFKAEKALVETFSADGVQIRPAFIYGTRHVGNFGVPLWAIGKPLSWLTSFRLVRALTTVPLVGPVLALPLTPPVSVEAVARAAVNAALSDATPTKNILDVDDLQEYEK